MYKLKQLFLLLCIGSILIAGCSDDPERPDKLIPEDDYINLLVELQLIKSFSESSLADSISVDSLVEVSFEKYGTNQEQFAASHTYYQQFPEAQKERIDSAIERLRMDERRDRGSYSDTAGTNQAIPPSSDTARPPTQPSSL